MAGLFQGDPLPDVTSTTQTQATAPEFYTNYLQDIANLGQNAVQQGGVAGFSPLQQQAFQMVPDVVADYMNPYTRGVVDEMGRLQQRSIQENILPNLGAAAAGSGQFGSRRQAQITGNSLRDLQSDLLGKQMQALQSGYTEAGKFAQADLSRALQAGQGFTQLGQEQQQLGLGGLKAMSEFGGQQQALGQKMLDYPMAQAQAFSQLMRQYQVPGGSVQQTTGPDAGSYSNSPLSQISGLLAGLGAFLKKADGGAVIMKNGGKAHRSKAHAYLARGGSVKMAR